MVPSVVLDTVVCKLFMEHYIFRNAKFSIGILVDYPAMDFDNNHDLLLLQNRSFSRMVTSSVFVVGVFCKLFNLYGLDDQLINVKNLVKKYDGILVVNNISFQISKGQFVAMMGHNGAGKSTVINILSTASAFDRGKVYIDGVSIESNSPEVRKNIGIAFQNGVLDEMLTVKENLAVRAGFYGMGGALIAEQIKKISKLTAITHLLNMYYGKLSGGDKRRCDIARALIHNPKILLLDEPTQGLDPQNRKAVWEVIENIRCAKELTVLTTTHYFDEALLADKIIVMKKGRITYDGTPQEIDIWDLLYETSDYTSEMFRR